MKKFFLALMILSCSALMAEEIEKPLISILNFESSGISESETGIITDFLSSHIVETDLYQVLDRGERDIILAELEFSLTGCVDESCQLEIGRLLQADEVIVGSIGKIGTKYLLNLKLLNVETGATIITNSAQYSSLDELIDDSKTFIFNFFLDEDADYTYKQSEIQDQYITEKLEGYDPERFQKWLKDNNYEQSFIAGDGFMKNDYIARYKSKELGMRFTLNPEIGYSFSHYHFQDSELPGEIYHGPTLGLVACMQLWRNFGFGLHGNLTFPVNTESFNVWFNEFGPIVFHGNKMDDYLSFGYGISYSGHSLWSVGIYLFMKGYHLRISSGFLTENFNISINAGFSLF